MVVRTIAGILLAFVLFSTYLGIHQVPEGHIGLYWFGGKLLDETTEPGLHTMMPYVTRFSAIQVTLQTDTVVDIPCGTSGGSMIYFDKIEVVNVLAKNHAHATVKAYGVNYDKTWIFDRVAHEINQFCSSHTLQEVYIDLFEKLDEALAESLQKSCDQHNTGIEIVAIRVTKPRIPEAVKRNYEAIETAKTEFLVQKEREKVAKAEEEISLLRATMSAQKDADVAVIVAKQEAAVAMINTEKEIKQKEAQKLRAMVEADIELLKRKVETDAHFYQISKSAEANKLLYTEEYLRALLYQSLANNTKIYFGDKIPTIFSSMLSEKDKMPFP
eukprot:TRINITY_DN1841_c0_g1_i1.p1 TRINITY_DN1841_c0_g1~~TRINITY_DN1841_c0_g1_i1.p1  ORF type:complete len:337 (-),score=60.76 TRINITY_DN1841_c0_g1_i1:63-1049(-)